LSKAQSGRIEILRDGATERLNGKPTWAIAREGIIYVPETKPVFEQLSVEENLKLVFAAVALSRQRRRELRTRIYDSFPVFSERRTQLAGTLSGGQKRMLSIAKALLFMDALDARNPERVIRFKLLLLDEPTHGLHPTAVSKISELLREVNSQGVSILIIEQMVPFALSLATRGYLMRHGEIVTSGSASELLNMPALTELYLGVAS
jgi:branched-chain amino acid transport system ATP-binding protein